MSEVKGHARARPTRVLRWMRLTDSVAAAGQAAAAARVPVVVVQASLAVGAVGVVGAVFAVTPVTRGPVQLGIEVTLGALPTAVAC